MEKDSKKGGESQLDDDTEAEERAIKEAQAKDKNYMTPQLQGWLTMGRSEGWYKALKFAKSKNSRGSLSAHFFSIIEAYCQLKQGKTQECHDILADFRGQKPMDSQTAIYLSYIYNELGRHADATTVLEVAANDFKKRQLNELLFFAYVRQGNLLKQQNQALQLYKNHQEALHAQWAVESMYLISLNLKFETRVLDIAYLLMLKLMKEPNYSIDKKFILLYVKVLQKQGKYKDAAAFMERNADHFKDKSERQKIEAEIFLQMKNYVMCIETFFGMLRLNSHIKHFVNMWPEYRQAICIVCNEYVYNHVGLEFKIDYERPIGK